MDNILNGSYEQTERTFKHRVAFVERLRREPDMRRRMFDTLEQRFRQDFASDRTGKNLYDVLHAAVRDADVPGLETEFERRFLPLLEGRAPLLEIEAVENAGRGKWIAPLVAVAVVVLIAVVGIVVLDWIKTQQTTRVERRSIPQTQAPQLPLERPKPTGPVIREVEDPPPDR
jgi:hypothetical protein